MVIPNLHNPAKPIGGDTIRMRKQSGNGDCGADARTGAARAGRCVLTGFGLDGGDGHVRFTHLDGTRLYGGSERMHAELQRLARRIHDEAERLGISFDSMTYDDYLVMKDVVDRVNCEIPAIDML